jgi:murein DD-endopeptidase MepM/ murein hydrolase activator NlpD
VQAVIPTLATFQPPLLAVPQRRILSDHYLFARPVDSNANNRGLSYYPYGSNGAQHSNPQRSHTGIDITNPLNETIRAAGAGRVIFASSPERPYLEGSPAYGNAVLIEHDFSWEGQPLYTLYAHMARVLVLEDAWVNVGDPIGLNGDTGQATGPHVHFEVRLGGGRFGDTVNPYLWMVPYVGYGTIAGRVIDSRGNFIDDADVTLRSYANAITVASTTTYTFFDTVNDVNPDPLYNENFVFGDVPAGRYEVIVTIDGQRIIELITVSEGTTSVVELRPGEGSSFVAGSQPVEEAPTPEATQPVGGP